MFVDIGLGIDQKHPNPAIDSDLQEIVDFQRVLCYKGRKFKLVNTQVGGSKRFEKKSERLG